MKNICKSHKNYKLLTLILGLSLSGQILKAADCPMLEGNYNCRAIVGESKEYIDDLTIKQKTNENGKVVYYLPYNADDADSIHYKKIADNIKRTHKEKSHLGTTPVTIQTKCISNTELVDSAETVLTVSDEDNEKKMNTLPISLKTKFNLLESTKQLVVIESLKFGTELRESVSICTKK